MGNDHTRNISSTRYANIYGNNSSKEIHSFDENSFVFQLILYLFPYTYSLSCSSYYRYQKVQSSIGISESRWNQIIRISSVYIIFGYTFLFVLFWSYITTASYTLAWILSPFGISLGLFSLYLYIRSQRLQLTDFRIQRSEELLNESNGSKDN